MSGQYHSQQSEIMIDVSHREDSDQSSSPIPMSGGVVSRRAWNLQDEDEATIQDQETADIVQDSFEPIQPAAAVSGHVSSGATAQDINDAPKSRHQQDDEEEMYGLSPKGQQQHESTKAARQSASKSQDRDGALGQAADAPQLVEDKHENRDAKDSEAPADQQPLTRAQEKTAASAQPPKERASTQTHSPAQEPERQHSQHALPLQTSAHKSTVLAAALPRIAAAAPAQTNVREGQQSTEPGGEASTMSKKPVRAAKQSALEALRAKNGRAQDNARDGKGEDASHSAAAQSKVPKVAPNAVQNLLKDSSQLPTPVTEGAADRSNKRPTTGKLPTHQARSFMTPAAESLNDAPRSSKRKAVADTGPEPGDDRTNGSRRPGSLKHPSKKDQAANLREQQKAALQSAHNSHEQHGTAKRGRGRLKQPAKETSQAGLRRERSDTYQVSTPANKWQRRSMSRASKASSMKTAKGGRTRQLMQETSNLQNPWRGDSQPKGQAPRPQIPQRSMQDADGERSVQQSQKQKERPSREKPNAMISDEIAVQKERDEDAAASAAQAIQPTKPNRSGSKWEDANLRANVEQDAKRSGLPGTAAADQDNGVFLSQGQSPGSSTAMAARTHQSKKPLSDATADAAKQSRPQTPLLRSSPPTGARSLLVPDSTRPSIISFGKGGPVNQGTGRSSAPGSAQTTHTVLYQTRPAGAVGNASSRQKLEDRRSNLQSSAAKTERANQNTHHAAPNVARDSEDLFGAFTQGGNNPTLATMLKEPKHDAPKPQRTGAEGSDTGLADDFMNIDDMDGTTLLEDDQAPAVFDDEPTVSQVAMPPPGGRAKKVKDDNATIDLQTTETKPPAHSVPREPLPTKKVQESAVPAPPPSIGAKRRARPSPETEASSKRRKPNKPRATQISDTPDEDDGAVSNVSGSQTAPIKSKQKPTIRTQPEPVKRALRGQQKPPRQASQGSVDMTGSPYPKSMDVPRRATALEVFSQQAGLFSDHDLDFKVTTLVDGSPHTSRPNVRLPPPSAELAVLSSNSKPIPAPPQAVSQAVCRIASGAVAERLLIRDQAREPPTDPFTSSEEQHQSDKSGHETEFLKALRETGFRTKAQAGKSDISETVVDPDKTWVEPERARFRPPHGKKRATSISSESSSDPSSESQRSDVDEDVVAWRSALKPHQADLFDSLVVVSHKLVRHLVDRETATADIVADYRRRGERIVSSLEKTNADSFDKRLRALADQKKQATKKLKAINDRLGNATRGTQPAMWELGGRKRGQSKLESTLQEMAETYA